MLLMRYSVLTYVYRLQQLLFIVYLLCVVYAAFQANKVVYTLWTIKKGGSTFVIITLENLDGF